MALRPASARWFEIVVPREDAGTTLEALARAGRVQFEWTDEHDSVEQAATLGEAIGRYRALAADLARFWPEPTFERRCCPLPLEKAARAAVRSIEHWHRGAGPLLGDIERLRREQAEMDRWGPLLRAFKGTSVDLRALAGAGPVLAGYCLILPEEAEPPSAQGSLHAEAALPEGRALLGLAPRERLADLCAEVRSQGGECLELPAWAEGDADRALAELSALRHAHERGIERAQEELRRTADAQGLAQAIGVLERLDWFRSTAEKIACDARHCWVSGWTSEPDAAVLERSLRDAGVDAGVRFAEPPADAPSPSISGNPGWMRPFEVFTRAVGIPGGGEADPTAWVALLVPLMFGYMCGDVGHGLVIVAAGLFLRRRWTLWPLLVYCGAAATAFGFVYGDVFGFDHLLDPLWVHPLADPLIILAVPVIGGALVLSVGVLLHAVQTCWRGEGRLPWLADAAQLLVYWGLILALVDARFGWAVGAGVVLCAANRLWTQRSAAALAGGLGQLAESTFELLLNTLSFARVGAFALAHAALEFAVISTAATVQSLWIAGTIVVLGNVLVIVVEGVVVSIQTTRLVLFEFFIRFFEGTGRLFTPAPSPPSGDGRPDR